jgi:hypothetical protein
VTTFSVHQWSDLRAGLREIRRVTRGPVVILTCDPDLVRAFWLHEYAPEVLDTEARRYPSTTELADGLGGVTIDKVPVPLDCTDGFNEAYYGRPEALLAPNLYRERAGRPRPLVAGVACGASSGSAVMASRSSRARATRDLIVPTGHSQMAAASA